MTQPKITWKTQEGLWAIGDLCYLGYWKVGHVYNDGGTSKDQEKKYMVKCFLPGIKPILGHYLTVDLAKAKLELAVNMWLTKITEELK